MTVMKRYNVKLDRKMMASNDFKVDRASTFNDSNDYDQPNSLIDPDYCTFEIDSASTVMVTLNIVILILIALIIGLGVRFLFGKKILSFLIELSGDIDWSMFAFDVVYLIGHGIRIRHIERKYHLR